MIVGIVILNYNVADSTIRLANYLYDFLAVDYIVIVDNDSNSQDKEKLNKYFKNICDCDISKKISFIQSPLNGGYAKGNNIGLRYLAEKCDCDICFIANPDIIISEQDFNNILDCFDKYNEFSVLTCAREYNNGKKLRQYWNLAGYRQLLLECFCIYRWYEKRHEIFKKDYVEPVITVGVAPGAFWGVRSTVLQQVDYLDEGTFLFYEESCFARKIQGIGGIEGLVTGSCYKTYPAESSTVKIRRNRSGFVYLMDSKDYYLKKYLTHNKIKILLWSLCKNIALLGNRIRHISG